MEKDQETTDRAKQALEFAGWFKTQTIWPSMLKMSIGLNIARTSLRNYINGNKIARGDNRAVLYEHTKLDCFAPHQKYNARYHHATNKTIRAQPDKTEANPQAIIDRLYTGLSALESKMNFILSGAKNIPGQKPKTTEGEDKKEIVILNFPDLPEADASDTVIDLVRTDIINLTKKIAAYSNLPTLDSDREKARAILGEPAQQLFIALLVFDQQYPSDFQKQSQGFIDILGIVNNK